MTARITAGLSAALLAVFLCLNFAHAHEWVPVKGPSVGKKIDASWIMNNPLTAHCCGPKDCEPVPGRTHWTPDKGWRVRGWKGSVPSAGTYQSIDGQPWACRDLKTNKIRCLFISPSGQ